MFLDQIPTCVGETTAFAVRSTALGHLGTPRGKPGL